MKIPQVIPEEPFLGVVDLTQIENVSLHTAPSGAGHLFTEAVIVVLLAVFASRVTLEVHAWAPLYPPGTRKKGGRSVADGFAQLPRLAIKHLRHGQGRN